MHHRALWNVTRARCDRPDGQACPKPALARPSSQPVERQTTPRQSFASADGTPSWWMYPRALRTKSEPSSRPGHLEPTRPCSASARTDKSPSPTQIPSTNSSPRSARASLVVIVWMKLAPSPAVRSHFTPLGNRHQTSGRNDRARARPVATREPQASDVHPIGRFAADRLASLLGGRAGRYFATHVDSVYG